MTYRTYHCNECHAETEIHGEESGDGWTTPLEFYPDETPMRCEVCDAELP